MWDVARGGVVPKGVAVGVAPAQDPSVHLTHQRDGVNNATHSCHTVRFIVMRGRHVMRGIVTVIAIVVYVEQLTDATGTPTSTNAGGTPVARAIPRIVAPSSSPVPRRLPLAVSWPIGQPNV